MNLKKDIFLKIKSFASNNRQMIFFILRVLIIYIAWKIIIWFLGEERIPLEERHWPWLSAGWEQFNNWIRIFMLYSTKFVLEVLGYSNIIISGDCIIVHDLSYVGIGNYCLGIQLWLFIVALIWSYPGKWKRKLLYSVLGIIAINILNILRFVTLIFAFHAYPKQMQFNHDYVFNVVVYIFTFMIWVVYVRRGKEKLKISKT